MNSRDQVTARPAPLVASVQASGHEHGWRVESSHPTSDGRVLYVICGDCGARRVDLQCAATEPPAAMSRELGAASPASSQRRTAGSIRSVRGSSG